MKLVETHKLEEGNILATPLYNESGRVLLQSNITLTKRMIDQLLRLDISFVYIWEDTDHFIQEEDYSQSNQMEAVDFIEKCFVEIQKGSKIYRQISVYKAAPTLKLIIKKIQQTLIKEKDLMKIILRTCDYDQYTFVHSLNVTVYSLALGMEMGMNFEQLELLGLGAILHDAGKMLIPNEIITKPSRLTEEEYATVKKHTEYGYQLLKDISNVPYIVPICAYQHHERLNGSGYPNGLQAEHIHLYAKIIGVADVYDAVTSNRVYKKGILPYEALEMLYTGAGTLFDANMISMFRKVIIMYPTGMEVKTTDGREGIVALQNPGMGDRPVLRIYKENDNIIKHPYLLDLKTENNVLIVNQSNKSE